MPSNPSTSTPSNAKPRRKSTGKRARFEVFKRDHFTCQYCGAQPPDVVLVVDHITPVAAGGTSTPDNLITACESCNQGKADIPLGDRQIRPDADLLYLETQQEIVEIQRYQAALQQKEAALNSLVESLQDTWCDVSGLDWHPSGAVVRSLLNRYSPEIAGEALIVVAGKVGGGYIKTHNNSKWVAYLNAVARNMAAEDGDL